VARSPLEIEIGKKFASVKSFVTKRRRVSCLLLLQLPQFFVFITGMKLGGQHCVVLATIISSALLAAPYEIKMDPSPLVSCQTSHQFQGSF
jgi:hypothetical protein